MPSMRYRRACRLSRHAAVSLISLFCATLANAAPTPPAPGGDPQHRAASSATIVATAPARGNAESNGDSFVASNAESNAESNAGPAYGPELQGFAYPYPVNRFDFMSQRTPLHMAYIDVMPAQPNGRTVVLLHGKNFCAATWQETIDTLAGAGYRVIAPDQIGFCKSSKPAQYQYSFQQLANNTHALLMSLGIETATVIGHSTGGMLAARYALMYPAQTQQLVLVNPIGLEDWKALGVPSKTVDEWFDRELRTSAPGIRRYERSTYYAGQWSERYEPWVQMLAGMYRGPGKRIVAWNSALLYDMIYTQPVVYEFGKIRVPTLLMIGDKDTTAIGKDFSPPEVQARIGHYPALAKTAHAAIPGSTLVEFPDLGHAPQMQDPAAFHKALLAGLAALH
ncbi:alpha/beta fold hydrolase [Pandoraea faecigallinarum]|uniref:alpha/beta fold hydrolase n=1 Tax=Pandoraea faecigallinarum TaxID=656179 RepID=UPI000A018972|nr:alpha/beta hydrolase [Pandoraea faecigallinarum]